MYIFDNILNLYYELKICLYILHNLYYVVYNWILEINVEENDIL